MSIVNVNYSQPATDIVQISTSEYQLHRQKEAQLAVKEGLIQELQQETQSAYDEMEKTLDKYQSQNIELEKKIALLSQKILLLESQAKQDRENFKNQLSAKEETISCLSDQNDQLYQIIKNMHAPLQKLKDQDWSAGNKFVPSQYVSPNTNNEFYQIWLEAKKNYFGDVPADEDSHKVYESVDNGMKQADKLFEVLKNPQLQYSNPINVPKK